MFPTPWLRDRGRAGKAARRPRFRPAVEGLEDRSVPSGLTLTPLVQVSGPSPLDPAYPPPNGTPQINSEVEPQVAVNPSDPRHVVGVWQQDRFTGSGARALVAGVSHDGGVTWAVDPIPGFNSAVADSPYQRYSDPWVSIAADGTVYVSALAVSFRAGFPSTSAILATTSTDGGSTWAAPATVYATSVPAGTNPIDLLNDKEAITADPTDPTGRTSYLVWDRLNLPGDQSNANASRAFAFRGDTLFAKTTDGGATWQTQVIFAPLANQQTIGHQIAVLPDGTLVDSFTLLNGSGNQPERAGQNHLAVMRSADGGQTWSVPIVGPVIRQMEVSDPDTGDPVRVGEVLADFAAGPDGRLYLVWSDARFSDFGHNDVAFSTSTDGGLTWSAPVKVNQTPATIPEGNQQTFTPSVAVAANGTVAVTYYDFRNNTPAAGLPTDYWLAHADGDYTNPASWADDEKRLTDASFDLENAAKSRGYFLGDYAGLAAAGDSFYALFAQAGLEGGKPGSNIFFRDPPPADGVGVVLNPKAPGGNGAGIAGPDGATLDQARSRWFDDNPTCQGLLIGCTPQDDSQAAARGNRSEPHDPDQRTVMEVARGRGDSQVIAEKLGLVEQLTLRGVSVDGPEMLTSLPGVDEAIDLVVGVRQGW